jgi:alpha-tubulin suppressor-like RCC1 family protein
MLMKSITPVVSVILMVLITIVASVSAFFFINSNVSDLEAQGSVDTYPGNDNSRLNLVSVTGSKAIVRNDGTSPVTEVVMFVNNELLNYTLDTPIQPGELRQINYAAREIGEDLEIKVIYNAGKTVSLISPASKNTNSSGFIDNPLPLNNETESGVLEFLRVNSVIIINQSYGLQGYCNATSDNSEDLLRYNFSWSKNDVEIVNNIKFIAESISAGEDFSCGILINGSAMCWGYNYRGMLGNNSQTESHVPVYVYGNYNFSNLDSGGGHSCGVLTNGSGVCWGSNNNGELGNGSSGNTYSLIPVFVNGNYNFNSITVGYAFSCGVLVNGSGVCWGYNVYGQLGNGSFPGDSSIPVFVSGDYTFNEISVGLFHSCGILTNGSGVCWGRNNHGQLGDDSTTNRDEPVFVSGNYNYSSVSAGGPHACGVLVNGSGVCWGYNDDGELGIGSSGNEKHVPVFVFGDYNFSSIVSGGDYSCGILTNGSGVCWGYNAYGNLGTGDTSYSTIPKFINYNGNFSSISATQMNYGHSCGILTNGSAMCWGKNSYGKLGDNSITNRNSPVFIYGNYNFINNSYYWNKNTLISILSSNYYSPSDDVTFKCIAMNEIIFSSPVNYTFSIPSNTEPDYSSSNCLNNDSSNIWFTGLINGSNGACCGDDGILDDFYNSTNYCCDGLVNQGTCHCGDGTCQIWENVSNCNADCGNICFELSGSCNYTYFSGIITMSNSSYCACCGDDGINDIFNNESLFCSKGGVIYDQDAIYGEDWLGDNYNYSSGKDVCELNNNTWIIGNGSFTSYVSYGVADSPIDIVLGDLDNDGDLDLITANLFGNSISVLEGNGDGTFVEPDVVYGIGQRPYDLALGDLNNDGNLDLVSPSVQTGYNYVSVYLGYENISFITPYLTIGVGTKPAGVALGDLNNDGNLDMVTANGDSDDISVLIGNGDGTFVEPDVTYSVGDEPKRVALGDLNGDSNLDLVVSNWKDYNISVLIGNGDGTFVEPDVTYIAGYELDDSLGPWEVNLGDLDNDGDLDIVSSCYGHDNITVWIGKGDGTFTNISNYFIINPWASRIGDVDGDNDLDIVAANYGGSTVSVLFSYGNGSFKLPADTYNSVLTPHGIALGDLDNDGDLDLISSSSILGTDFDKINVFINNGIYGDNGPCCGDDGINDNFSNNTHQCISGVFSEI